MDSEQKSQSLKRLALQIGKCRLCPLYKTATQAVAGEGKFDANIMFVGEAPGYYEDQQGRPFVGQAGQLLDSLIAGAGLTRSEVFITNVLKHRPPNNRDPQTEEIAACASWLDEQIKIVDPKIIVTLGRFSLAKFIPGVTISKVHGQKRLHHGRIIVPMFHPAAALRSAPVMEQLKQDFRQLSQLLSMDTATGATARAEKPEHVTPKQQSLF